MGKEGDGQTRLEKKNFFVETCEERSDSVYSYEHSDIFEV